VSRPPEGEKGLHLSLRGSMCFDRPAEVNAAAAL